MRLDVSDVDVFQEKTVPRSTKLAGWSLLVRALAIAGPVRHPSCVSEQHVRGSRRQAGGWAIFDKRYWPGDTLADHLSFAVRHEPIDLLLLKRIFTAVPPAEIESLIHAAPTGVPARRLWYLYELLTGRTLDAADAPNVTAVDLLDPETYFTGTPRLSKRHRLRDNLPGTGRFCPIIRRTPALTKFIELDLAANFPFPRHHGPNRSTPAVCSSRSPRPNPLRRLAFGLPLPSETRPAHNGDASAVLFHLPLGGLRILGMERQQQRTADRTVCGKPCTADARIEESDVIQTPALELPTEDGAVESLDARGVRAAELDVVYS